MKNLLVILFVVQAGLLLSCKGNEKENTDENSFPTPALEIIKGQVAQVDSSVDPIIKRVPLTDSTYDSTSVNRKDFRALAKDFLETPDISGKLKKKYKEERTLDNNLGQAIFTAVPLDDQSLEVRRQEIRIVPNPPDDKIKSVYIEKFKSDKDSSVMKRMTWYMDKKFQVVTITQKPGQEDKVSVIEVIFGQSVDE
jgi:hypothetical protein